MSLKNNTNKKINAHTYILRSRRYGIQLKCSYLMIEYFSVNYYVVVAALL